MRHNIICILCVLAVFVLGICLGHETSSRAKVTTAFKSGEIIQFHIDRNQPCWAEDEIGKAIMSYSIKK